MSEEMIVDMGGGKEKRVPVNYPANSKKRAGEPQKPIIERPPVEKVITGQAVRKKKPFTSKLSGSLISEDSGSVSDYIVTEVMVPAAKNMLSSTVKMITDAIFEGVEQAIFGSSRPRREGKPGYTSYNRVRPAAAYETKRELSRQARATHDFDDILLPSRGEAQDVIDQLLELISLYEVAKVSDLYDLVGLTGSFTDEKWGWTDLSRSGVRLDRGGGYLLVLPRPQPLTD